MKTMNIPGFTAEASLGGVGIFRVRRLNKGTLATGTVRPALIRNGGGGGFHCSPDDSNCVDCDDDIDNIICAECQAGGSLQCCQDPELCAANPRPTLNCGDPSNAHCLECAQEWSPEVFPCCLARACNVIPASALPPHCFRLGGRTICIPGLPITVGSFESLA